MSRYFAGAAALVVSMSVLAWVAAGDGSPRQSQSGSIPPSAPADITTVPGGSATLLAAGDIAGCSSAGDEATAAILDSRPHGVVATLGDNVYRRGTPEEFEQCYGPSWGRHRQRTRPALGNHDYGVVGASGYFGYFGLAAGEPSGGYYSYQAGDWHVVVLNSNCGVVACAKGSVQEQWLRADLAAHPSRCTLAYWHHPRFSSGSRHGSTGAMADLYAALYEAGADLVLAGHDHVYERLAPLDPEGRVDHRRGIRSFIVGTGGYSLYSFSKPLTGSEVRHSATFGVLALELDAAGYSWEFLPVAGGEFTDSGSGACH